MSSEKDRQAVCSNVCRMLREERIKRGVSMTMLAVKTGLSQQAISYMEREMRTPNLDTLLRIADAIQIDLGEILIRARKELSKSR
jgi:transcriptional regulator with XRE-family HTH domain